MTSVPQLLVPGVGGKGPDDQDSDQYLVMFNLKPKVNSWYAESLTAGTGHFSGETRTAQNAPRLVAAPLHGQSSRAETVARGRASRHPLQPSDLPAAVTSALAAWERREHRKIHSFVQSSIWNEKRWGPDKSISVAYPWGSAAKRSMKRFCVIGRH